MITYIEFIVKLPVKKKKFIYSSLHNDSTNIGSPPINQVNCYFSSSSLEDTFSYLFIKTFFLSFQKIKL